MTVCPKPTIKKRAYHVLNELERLFQSRKHRLTAKHLVLCNCVGWGGGGWGVMMGTGGALEQYELVGASRGELTSGGGGGGGPYMATVNSDSGPKQPRHLHKVSNELAQLTRKRLTVALNTHGPRTLHKQLASLGVYKTGEAFLNL
jgi:hypothetical protein